MVTGIIVVIIAYVLGSIPFAYIFTRFVRGIDIRQVGTGNVGTMNTMRETGVGPGLAVLVLDMGKGSLSVFIAQWLGVSQFFVFLSGFAAVVGHNWPIFLLFKGGRGAATTLGVLVALTPREFIISFVIIVIIVLITRSSGLGIGVGLAFLPLFIWLFEGEISFIIYSIALSLFLGLRNIFAFKRDLAKASSAKDYILGKNSPFWQRRKK